MLHKQTDQTNTTKNNQPQDTNSLIHRIQINQIINALKEIYLAYWNKTQNQNKLQCYLALNRAEYLTTKADTDRAGCTERAGYACTVNIATLLNPLP